MGHGLKTTKTQYHRIGGSIKEFLFPSRCLVCGSFFHPGRKQNSSYRENNEILTNNKSADFGFKTLLSGLLCPGCISGYIPYESPLCTRCGMMFQSREGTDHECGNCIEHPKNYRIARAAGIYSDTMMKAVHVFKYKGKIQLAKPFGNVLFAAFLRFWDTADIDLIIPVPLHISRFRERGFNQAYLMIKDWLKTTATERA